MTHRARRTAQRSVLLITSLVAGGCSRSDAALAPPATGTVRISVSTAGSRLDADGYDAIVGGQQRKVGLNDTVTFTQVPAQEQTVRLNGVAANCDGYPAGTLERNVSVSPGSTAGIEFRVLCGSLVLVDEAHFNYNTISGRYAVFADFLRGNGYVVKHSGTRFARDSIPVADVLVIVNALSLEDAGVALRDETAVLPTAPAFLDSEVIALRDWVAEGGSLFLIADNMPFGGAAEALAAAFGVRFSNGFAYDEYQLAVPRACLADTEIQMFRRSDGSLGNHPITNGRSSAERIDSIATFSGQAFQVDSVAQKLLVFGPHTFQFFPRVAWSFPAGTQRVAVDGWQQGAIQRFGRGRLAVLGDATLFLERFCGPNSVANGMNNPKAAQNRQFLLNLVRWLDDEQFGGT